jgi:hypothetical protein
MTQVLRGQQGYPAGPVDRDEIPGLPSAEDWEYPEQAEAAVEAAREALAAGRGRPAPRASDERPDLVREAEEIEEDVAPGRGPGDDEPPNDASTND